MYEKLDAAEILSTIERLTRRVEERFPTASLVNVSRRLEAVARASTAQLDRVQRPNLGLRIGVALLLAASLVVLALFVPELRVSWKIQAINELVETVEGMLGSLFFIGTGILFLVTLESRLKRARTLAAVHELRSLAHIVDMHQLTKDPEQLLGGAPPTASSPERRMTDYELVRYLDYCTEMLALISKLGALYAQRLTDPVVLGAVDEIEDLTNGLSGRIWQKIDIVDQVRGERRQDRSLERLRRLGAGTSGAKTRQLGRGGRAH